MDTGSTTPLRPHTLLKWGLMCAAIIILGAIFVGGYGGLNTLMNVFGQTSVAEDTFPSGSILFSAGIVSTTTGSTVGIAPLTLTLINGTPDIQYLDRPFKGPTLQYSVSKDSSYGTFLGSAVTSNVDTALNVYRADFRGASSYDDIMQSLKEAVSLTAFSDADAHREFPVISPDGIVLYSSLSAKAFATASSSLGSLPANNWNIILVDEKGAVHAVTQGLRPKWVDTTHFAYLKNDGVYLYDLESGASTQVWASDNLVTIANGFDVSDDAGYMAFSDPAIGTLTLFRALNWTGNIVSVISVIPVVETNLVFSPDSKYLAGLVLRPSVITGDPSVVEIEYYSLATPGFISTVVPFDRSLFTGISVTDWKY